MADALAAAWPFPDVPLTRIGTFTAENPGSIAVMDAAGNPLSFSAKGYDHFGKT